MKRSIMLMALWSVLSLYHIFAQNVVFFTSKQGLSNSNIRSIYEDSRQNIWVTTQNGLSRYDGVKMNVYRHVLNDSTSLKTDESTCVMELDRDHLLVGTSGGLQCYDYATDRFTDVPFLNDNGAIQHPRIVNIGRMPTGKVLVSTDGFGAGLLDTDEDGRRVLRTTTELTTGKDNVSPYFFYEDRQHGFWIVNTYHQLYHQEGKTQKLHPELKSVLKLCESTSGKLYAATSDDGIYVYNAKLDRFNRVVAPNEAGGIVYGFHPWTSGRMLLCSDGGGLRVYDEKTKQLSLSTIMVKDFNLSTSNAKDAIFDSYGNVWVGIYRKGLMMKPINKSPFEYVGQHSITKNSIGSNSVFAMAKGKDGLWVATDNDGLYLMSNDGTHSQHWNREQDSSIPLSFTAMHETKNGSTLLLGTYTEGLWVKEGNAFRLVTKVINHVFDIQAAAEPDCYWIATMGNGFYYYNHASNQMVQYTTDWSRGSNGTRILGNPYVYSILRLDNRLFVCTADGLTICYVEKNGVIRRASTKLLTGYNLRHVTASADKSTIWLATSRGLVKMNAKTLATTTYTTENELPVNSITSLCMDGDNLWVGTDFGLSYMDVKEEKFTNFFSDDGLQDNEFCRGAVVRTNDFIYFGGIGGITYFDAGRMDKWQHVERIFQVKFVDVFIGNRLVHTGDLSDGYDILQGVVDDVARIDIGHSDNHFTLELCVPGFTGQHVSYEYSVNSGAWMDQSGNNSRIVFDNLEPGTYTIRVRARAMGTVSEERTFVAVVHPAWYASTGAKIFYFFIFLAICWFVYEYIKRRILARRVMARHHQQEELNEARIQFFMNISQEIRTPMTLILAPLQKLMARDPDPERQREYKLIQQNSKRILRLINQMMDVRKIEQGKFLLDYKKVELVGFIQNIVDVFVTNAQNRDIHYEFLHDMDELKVYVDADNTDKIIMNLLSNAFKFTPDGGTITVKLEMATNSPDDAAVGLPLVNEVGQCFQLSVTDSGVGIPDADKGKVFQRFYSAQHQNGYIGTGIGLNLTSMLVKLHKGTITVADNPAGNGTQFVVTMPVGDDSLLNKQTTHKPIVVDSLEQNDEAVEVLAIDKPTNSHRRNALLVEDDEAIRQYVHSELSKELVIHVCTNGQEAWDYLMAHPGKVDVVISDIMMPVMDGMTLCQKIKSNFTVNHIPVVLMTALNSDNDRIAGITNGADAYVSKPFNIDVLCTTVMQLLKTRQMLQGKFHGDRQQEEKIERVELESPDEHLMRRVMKCINENMSNPDLSVEIIADKVGISRVHFYRKMKDLTGQAPRDFVKYVRLKEAARLLSEKKLDITGVSVATGFKSLSAFSTNFKSLYGLSPTEWVKKQEADEANEEMENHY